MGVKSPNFRVTSPLISLKTSLILSAMASSELPPRPVLSNKLPPILKDHTCVSSITLEVSHPTRMSRSWMRLFDDEILAIWVGCNWKLYSDTSGGRGMRRPILRFRHSPTVCGPSSYKRSINLTFVPDLWLISSLPY